MITDWTKVDLMELSTPKFTDITSALVEGISDDSFKKAALWDPEWAATPHGRTMIAWDAGNVLDLKFGEEKPTDALSYLHDDIDFWEKIRIRAAGVRKHGSIYKFEKHEKERKAKEALVAVTQIEVTPAPKKKRGRPKKEKNIITTKHNKAIICE